MIFDVDEIRRIKAGRKTQHRRPIVHDKECFFKPGRAYTVESSTQRAATFKITIKAVERSRLDAMTLNDLRREGFHTGGLKRANEEFMEHWRSKHLKRLHDPSTPVWVLSFVLGDQTDRPRYLAARWSPHQGDYVESTARAMKASAEEVSESTQGRFAANSALAYEIVLGERRSGLQAALRSAKSKGAKNGELRTIQHNFRTI